MAPQQRFDDEQVRGIYRFMYQHVGNREEAEDLTEQVFVQAARATPPDASGPSTRQSMDARLRRAACTVANAYLGQFYLRFLATPDGECAPPQGNASSAERFPHVSAAAVAERILAQLPQRDRELLTYRLLRNVSLAETAARMRMSVEDALAAQWAALTNAARIAADETADERSPSLAPCAALGDDTQRAGG